MEILRNYLETMFRNMPNTPEVRRAKDELWQMMEDKYTSLMEEGLPENEAIAHVISEFGNLDDLSDVLDIERYLPARIENEKRNVRELGLEEVRTCVRDDRLGVILLAFGVFLCIVSVCGPVLMAGIGETLGIPALDGLGVAIFLLMVVAGVWTIVYSHTPGKQWAFIRKEPCSIDFASTVYLDEIVQTQAPQLRLIRSVGIVLCALSVVPVIILSGILANTGFHSFFDSIGVTMLFIMVGAGVMLIIFAGLYNRMPKQLLKLSNIDPQGMYEDTAPAKEAGRAWQHREVRWQFKRPRRLWMWVIAIAAAFCLVVGVLATSGRDYEVYEESAPVPVDPENAGELSDDFRRIYITVDIGSVEISAGDMFSFSGANATYAECYVQDGALIVSNYISDSENMPQLHITLPSGNDYDDVEVSVNNGNITVSDLSASSLQLYSHMGDITLKGGMPSNTYMNQSEGNVTVEETVFDNMEIDCTQGNVDITLPGGPEVYNLDLAAAVGSLTVGNEVRSQSGGVYTQHTDGSNLRVNCESGNIAVG